MEECMDLSNLKFDDNGLIPTIVQEVNTGEVMMMAYMNKDSIEMTLKEGYTYFWSRSRQVYWKKGETSGNTQEVKELLYDCDGDTLLVKVIQNGTCACHTGERTCFYRNLASQAGDKPARLEINKSVCIPLA
jgi:phosphoribosyl-AMP cyclohydrolase